MVNVCCICGLRQGTGIRITFHRFPSDPRKRKEWLESLELDEKDIIEYGSTLYVGMTQEKNGGPIKRVQNLMFRTLLWM